MAFRGRDRHFDLHDLHPMPVAIPLFVLDLPKLMTVPRIL
jgi:hypothetical protein